MYLLLPSSFFCSSLPKVTSQRKNNNRAPGMISVMMISSNMTCLTMTEEDRITEQIALEDKMDHIYTACFIRIDSRPDEIYYYQKMEDARYHFNLFHGDDSGLYRSILLKNGTELKDTITF